MEIRIEQLADGAMVAGKAGDADVVLVRKGDDFFALDAFCTHYHGPLADGAIVGSTIRCPWHHACFDLRTGSALGAPAMRALRTYPVVRDGDVVRVLPAPPEHIVILGAGAAGSFAASELRRIGFEGRVTLLTRETTLPYDKPNLSKDYLAGRAPQEWIPLRAESEYAEMKIDLRLGTTVEAIDAERSEVRLAGGERIAFDRLIVATGGSPRRLDVPTADPSRVHYLRTWTDADALREAAKSAKKAVVIGASFIGLEAAASLRELGLDVTVIGMEERPLERVLGREAGDFIRRTHESHGVRFRLGRRPVAIEQDRVVLDDESSEPCDFVVVGIGVEPVSPLGGEIAVDEYLQTSMPTIFAAGDIARFPDPRSRERIRVEHWAVAARQGQHAARNAMGASERFTAPPFFWSQHYDLVIAYVGHAKHANDAQLFGSLDEANAAIVYRDDGRIAAVATLFRDDVSLAVEAAMERNANDDELLEIVQEAWNAGVPPAGQAASSPPGEPSRRDAC